MDGTELTELEGTLAAGFLAAFAEYLEEAPARHPDPELQLDALSRRAHQAGRLSIQLGLGERELVEEDRLLMGIIVRLLMRACGSVQGLAELLEYEPDSSDAAALRTLAAKVIPGSPSIP